MQFVIFVLLGCCAVVHSASLPENTAAKRSSIDLELAEPSEIELIQDDVKREKRSGGFLSGIGSAILGKVAQASSGVSKGSGGASSGGGEHDYETVEYGPPVNKYDDSNFDIWSFKKAIINTLFQALKAIGGGVIALKGKLIKGGGVVISAKGNIISAKGEAISNLGRQIAQSAVLTPPKTAHSYVYEAPVHAAPVHAAPVHVSTGHDSYAGPPPSAYGPPHGSFAPSASSDSYGHAAYASPSEVVFSYAYLPNLRPDGSVEYHAVKPYQEDSSY